MDLKLRAHGVKHFAVFCAVWEAVSLCVAKGRLGCRWEGRKEGVLICIREFNPKAGRGASQVRDLLLQFLTLTRVCPGVSGPHELWPSRQGLSDSPLLC